jgi:hypothetical protein
MITAKSEWMQDEIIRIYHVPEEKLKVISPSAKSWIKDVLKLYKTVRGGSRSR